LVFGILIAPMRRFVGFAQRLRRGERRNLVLLVGVGLLGLNALYAVNPGRAFSGSAATIVIGGTMALLAIMFLLILVAEYQKRFSARPKTLVDVICLDCDLVGGKTAICPGCPYNPLSKKRQKEFDLLETI